MIGNRNLLNQEINPIHYGTNMVFKPSEEAKICLECPLPDCKIRDCPRFIEEKRKLKSKSKENQTQKQRKPK